VGLVLAFGALGARGAVTAQAAPEVAELVTDRPDQTESAVVVPRGTFQIELGVGYAEEAAGPADEETLELPGTLLRWGATERLEFRLAWAGHVDVRSGGPAAVDGISGLADPELGAKLSLLSLERGDAMDFALLAHVSVPVGDEAIGSPRADPSLRLNGAHAIGERAALGWNVGYEARSFEDPSGEGHTLGRYIYTAAFGFDVGSGGRWAGFVELFGDLRASDPAPDRHSIDGGLVFLVTPRMQVDFYLGAGLVAEAPDFFAGAGLSFRIPR
jgi:hypothetical protein